MITLVNRFLAISAICAWAAFLGGCNNAQSRPVIAPAASNADADPTLAVKVKTALMASDGVDNLDIRIRMKKGEIVLSGFADSQAQIDRSIAVVKCVAGVGRVVNRINIRKFT